MEAAINLRQSIDKYGDELAISRQREACLKLCEQRGRVTVEYWNGRTPCREQTSRPARSFNRSDTPRRLGR
jgi:hypothetical protein